MDYKNISLIGFMGSGKTTLGRILAAGKNFLFIDLDRIIELEENKRIKDIFKIYGEDYFRNLESEVIKKIYINKNCIFACGGGVVNRSKNMGIIRRNSLVIYLSVSPENVFKRLKNTGDRPLIEVENREEAIRNLAGKRDKLYRKYADIIINNDRDEPAGASGRILNLLNS